MIEKKTKKIFADVSTATANEFLSRAKLSGTSGQSLIEGWVIDYLGGKKPALAETDHKWVDKLLYILRHGDSATRNVVTGNLSLFEKVIATRKNE